MSDPPRLGLPFRCPARTILADYVGSVPTLVGLPALLVVVRTTATGNWTTALTYVVWGAVLASALIPPVQWATTIYRIDADGLRQSSGIVSRRSTDVLWAQVRATGESATWSQRLFGLRTVSLRQEGETPLDATIRGADRALVELITAYVAPDTTSTARPPRTHPQAADVSGVPPGPDQPAHVPPPPMPGSPVFRATLRDLVAASLVNGKAILLSPSALLVVWGILEQVGGDQWVSARFGAAPAWLRIGAVIVLGAMAGVVASCLRYLGFTLRRDEAGSLHVTYGWPEHVGRVVLADTVSGVIVQANPLERVLGMVRLRLLTGDTGPQADGVASFPPLPVPKAREILARDFGVYGDVLQAESLRRSARPLLWLGVYAAAIGTGFEVGRRLNPGHGVLVSIGCALVTLLALIGIGGLVTSRFLVDGNRGTLRFTSSFGTRRETFVRLAAVQGVEEIWCPHGAPETAEPRSRRFVVAAIYAGGTRRLAALQRPGRWLVLLRANVSGLRAVCDEKNSEADG